MQSLEDVCVAAVETRDVQLFRSTVKELVNNQTNSARSTLLVRIIWAVYQANPAHPDVSMLDMLPFTDEHFYAAFLTLHTVHGTSLTRPFIQAMIDTNTHIMSITSEFCDRLDRLGVLDMCMKSWFPYTNLVASSDPSDWMDAWQHIPISEHFNPVVHSLAKALFVNIDNDFAAALLGTRPQDHDTPSTSGEPTQCVHSLVLRSDDACLTSLLGLEVILELKLRGLSQCPLRHIMLDPGDRHNHAGYSTLMRRFSPTARGSLPTHLAWQLFRVLFGNPGVSAYVAMGAAWAMRTQHKASIADLLCNMKRSLIEHRAIFQGLAAYLERLWIVDLMLGSGSSTSLLPLPQRPQSHIYSFLFCHAGGVQSIATKPPPTYALSSNVITYSINTLRKPFYQSMKEHFEKFNSATTTKESFEMLVEIMQVFFFNAWRFDCTFTRAEFEKLLQAVRGAIERALHTVSKPDHRELNSHPRIADLQELMTKISNWLICDNTPRFLYRWIQHTALMKPTTPGTDEVGHRYHR